MRRDAGLCIFLDSQNVSKVYSNFHILHYQVHNYTNDICNVYIENDIQYNICICGRLLPPEQSDNPSPVTHTTSRILLVAISF